MKEISCNFVIGGWDDCEIKKIDVGEITDVRDIAFRNVNGRVGCWEVKETFLGWLDDELQEMPGGEDIRDREHILPVLRDDRAERSRVHTGEGENT